MTVPRGFTLLEMLLSAVILALLVAAAMSAAAMLARDARAGSAPDQFARFDDIPEVIRFDLANARSIAQSRDTREVLIIGYCALDHRSLKPMQRLTRAVYRIEPGVGLIREQRLLDDPARRQAWTELVLAGAREIQVYPRLSELDRAVASTIRLRIQLHDQTSIERSIALR